MAGASDAPQLRRALGKWDLTAIGVNQVIGSAIFLLPADVATQVGPWGPLAFMAVGLLSLSIALCFAEAGSRFESTGGPYLPARAAFGRFVGFEVGWMMWFARVTSHASVVNGLTLALGFYWPALASGAPRAAMITGLTIALTWINVLGIKQSSWVVNTLTIGKLLPLAVFIVAGVWFIDPTRLTTLPAVSQQQASAAAILLIFAYGGYEVTGVLAGEAANPRRDVPFAFVAVLIIVSMVMSLTSMIATGILPDVAATRTPLADAAAIFLGAGGAAMIAVGSVISMTGNNMGQILNGSRTIFALAENGDLPRWFAKVHHVYRTPSNAIVFSAGLALVLALTGSFVALAAVSAIARLVMYLAVCLSTLVLRKRDREIAAQVGAHWSDPTIAVAPPKFTAPFGPVIPVVASIVALGILAGASRNQLISGVAALAAGAVLYFLAPPRPTK
ncbi:MAG TPA: APC family permease [Vicinamibacterales bacterium]|nr:APC family permease [Vicinamibacterales bacterium]